MFFFSIVPPEFQYEMKKNVPDQPSIFTEIEARFCELSRQKYPLEVAPTAQLQNNEVMESRMELPIFKEERNFPFV